MEYYPAFRQAILQKGEDSYVLLSRPPLPALRRGRSTCISQARRQHSS